MSLTHLCRHPLVSVDDTASLAEAARLMRAEHVGALVVVHREEGTHPHVLGLVSDRDLAVEVLARELPAPHVQVGLLVQGDPVTVPGSASLGEAAKTMREAGVRRLLVINDEQALVGLVSADDLLEAMAAELTELAQALRSGLLRESQQRAALQAPAPVDSSAAAAAAPPAAPAPAPRPPRVVFKPWGTPGMPEPHF
ncbi:CBS domain-containing protein [Ideonella sp. B7]|uniref:CBS domain-containing protein n=1 Tax=Ideonella benzenivorans TaxID=2831643 RepID=UPI001CED9C54|nr:CBS domain-containing protein [Ideonella benzenivorans]MCA6216128.1 CBS domain-containing protein [Ideonella benzenivorans]